MFPKLAVSIPGVLLILSPLALAQKQPKAPRIVVWNCSGCHGLDGNSETPYFPRLAGLNAAYSERRIKEFRATAAPSADTLTHRSTGPVPVTGASKFEARVNMIGIAHGMSADEIKDSSAWYGTQKPAAGHGGDAALIEAGRLLYAKSAGDKGAPACLTCHGAQAEGLGKTPRIAGQNGSYLLGELGKFKAGDRQHAPEMTMVAHNLDASQIRALAAFLESR